MQQTIHGNDLLSSWLHAATVAEICYVKLIQYGAKVLIPILQARARLQHRAGLRNEPTSSITPKLAKLATIIGDARTLWGIWGTRFIPTLLILKNRSLSFLSPIGMLPIIQWLISLERTPPPTRRLLTIERTQGWSMLAFYPLQHLSYFRKHDLIPPTLPLPAVLPSQLSGKPRRVTINVAAVSQWGSRLWATYIVLQLAHLREDRALLIKKQRALSRLNSVEKERAEIARRWDRWYNELAVNLSFLPMTIHWYASVLSHLLSYLSHNNFNFRSLEKGLFKNDVNTNLSDIVLYFSLRKTNFHFFRHGFRSLVWPPR